LLMISIGYIGQILSELEVCFKSQSNS
jgi:hypothetical protein